MEAHGFLFPVIARTIEEHTELRRTVGDLDQPAAAGVRAEAKKIHLAGIRMRDFAFDGLIGLIVHGGTPLHSALRFIGWVIWRYFFGQRALSLADYFENTACDAGCIRCISKPDGNLAISRHANDDINIF